MEFLALITALLQLVANVLLVIYIVAERDAKKERLLSRQLLTRLAGLFCPGG